MTDNALSRPFLLLLLLLQGLAHTATVHACTPQTFPTQGALSPVTLQSRVLDVVWPTSKRVPPNGTDSRTSKSAFALVADLDGFPGGGLWRSGDEGRSWKDESAALRSSLPPGADETTHVGITSIVWHDSNPQRLFLLGRGRFHWTSDDGGATYRGVATPGNTVGLGQVIRPHPRQPDWLMANVRRDACLIDPRSPLCALDLFISKDWGGSWTNLTEASGGKITGFRDFDWAAKLEHEEHEDGGKEKNKGKNLPDEAVLATAYLSQGSHGHRGLTPGWDADLHFVVTLDLFASPFAAVIACGNQFEIIAGKIFLAVPSECPVGPDGTPRTPGSGTIRSRSVTLYVSDRDSGATGDRWTTERLGKFVEACLPARLEDDGYTLIHTHDNKAAFVLADHAEPGSWGPLTDSPTSDAYAPAYAASLHTLSLPGVYRRDFVTDFTRVEGIPGAYVANQLDPTATAGGASRGKEASFLRTRLTLGGGGRWAAIRSPQSFRYGHCNACPSDSESCFLHLHGSTSWFASQGPHPGWYSLPTAPGLVLATGNVGPHLDMSPDADCTWMSRDGGVTWEDVADDTAIYEVGNHGGVVVMARHASEGPTNVIKFSIDDGECFHEVKLPEAVLIENIRVAPGGESTVFVAHGTACLKTDLRPECSFTGGSRPPGKMYVIDLKTLLSDSSLGWKLCDLSSDYERWSPLASECLLGMEHTFWRRKRGVACINPPNHLKTLEERFGMMTDGDHRDVNDDRKKNCICDADQDFECEFGFARDENGTCVQISGVTVEEACPRLANKKQKDYLMSSTHLRLVHGDVCTGVNAIIPDTNGKGGPKGSDKAGGDGQGGDKSGGSKGGILRGFFLLLFIGGIVAVAGGLIWSHCLSEAQRDIAKERLAPVLTVLAGLWEMVLGWVVDAVDWTRARAQNVPILNRFIGRGYSGGGYGLGGYGEGYDYEYEPLRDAGNEGGLDLDIDPEDRGSASLVAGHLGGGTPR